jgi:hypothetical protein
LWVCSQARLRAGLPGAAKLPGRRGGFAQAFNFYGFFKLWVKMPHLLLLFLVWAIPGPQPEKFPFPRLSLTEPVFIS